MVPTGSFTWLAALEGLAVLTGLAYVLLAIGRRRSCWIAGGLSTLAYLVLAAHAGLLLQSALQGLYTVLAVFGWWQWQGDRDAPDSFTVARLGGSGHVVALVALGMLALLGHQLLLRTGSPQPWLEAITTAGGLVATVLAARRFIDNWTWWVVTNLATAWLYRDAAMGPTAMLYVAYAALALLGWREWRRLAG
ncbi:MAG: nicotinamide riboside transporter PnuC [Gammaproteobacteria bacterium]